MRRAFGVILGMAVLGCGGGPVGGGDGGADGNTMVTADQACSEAAMALCTKIDSCTGPFIVASFGDMATCVERGKISCLRAVGLAGSGQTPAQIQACAQATAGAACDDLFAGKTPAACEPMMGMRANGSGCGDSWQCMSGFCGKASGASCGTCGPKPVAGDSCATIGCGGGGLTCAQGSKTCVGYATLNQNCGPNQPCLPTLSCMTPMGQMMGSCVMPLGAGAMCDPRMMSTAGCNSLQGLYCDGQQCAALTFANAGEPCGFAGGKITVCNKSGVCRRPPMSATGTCVAPAADGAACDVTMGPGCLPPAVCTGGACKIEDPSTCM